MKKVDEGGCQTCRDTEEGEEKKEQPEEGRDYQGLGFILSPTAR